MSKALVPVVDRREIGRPGVAAVALPEVIVDAGPAAVERFLEFFAAAIANDRTRAAYGQAAGRFLGWCAARGLGLRAIAPLHVAAYIRTHPGSAPTPGRARRERGATRAADRRANCHRASARARNRGCSWRSRPGLTPARSTGSTPSLPAARSTT